MLRNSECLLFLGSNEVNKVLWFELLNAYFSVGHIEKVTQAVYKLYMVRYIEWDMYCFYILCMALL